MFDLMNHNNIPLQRKLLHFAWLPAVALAVAACGKAGEGQTRPGDTAAEARRIAASGIIVDSHIDVPMKLSLIPADVSQSASRYDFDYPRAAAGGLNVPFMSIYTEAELEASGQSKKAADALIDLVEDMVGSAPDKFAIATSPADVRRQFGEGVISIAMGMENGSPIDGDLANLKHFFDRGIRYITLAHSLSNHIADSSYDEHRRWRGLSDFGVQVVHEMNRLGIMIDVSHVSDEAFWRVMELSRAPVIASHSSARHFTPGFERNMSDDMIRRLGENGGVIQVNFGSGFLTAAANAYDREQRQAAKAFLAEHPGTAYFDLEEQFVPQYRAAHGPYPYASIDDVLDHIDHIVALAGVDHVGIGSDFDGVGDSLPNGLKDVSAYPGLVEGLLRRGYSETDIRKILGENLLRVWAAVEEYAAQAAASRSSST
jgi:membrane dipeptidase